METLQNQRSVNYFRVAWQSALAAAFCLGLPAGLSLWLIVIRQVFPSALVTQAVNVFQANGLNRIYVLAVCSLMWSFLLARISGYRPWWKIGIATVLGIFIGWFSPLSNIDAWFGEGTPVHVVYAAAMCGIVAATTLFVGLSYGIVLRHVKAALVIAASTALVAVVTVLMTILVFDRSGIRVGGTVPLAMSKVTVAVLVTAAMTGGTALGVTFSRFAADDR